MWPRSAIPLSDFASHMDEFGSFNSLHSEQVTMLPKVIIILTLASLFSGFSQQRSRRKTNDSGNRTNRSPLGRCPLKAIKKGKPVLSLITLYLLKNSKLYC